MKLSRQSIAILILFLWSHLSFAKGTCAFVFADSDYTTHFLDVLDGQFRLGYDHLPKKSSKNKVVFVDGVGLSLSHSHGFARILRSKGIELVRFDMINVGNSLLAEVERGGHNYNPPKVSSDMQAQAVAEFISQISSQPVHLVGLSYGGAIASLVAKNNPELVKKLILVSSHVEDLVFINSYTAPTARWVEFVSSMNIWVRYQYEANRKRFIEHVGYKLMPTILKDHFRVYLEAFYQLVEGVRDFVLSDTLAEVEVPTHMIYGENDASIKTHHFDDAYSRLPESSQAGVWVIKDGHHDSVAFDFLPLAEIVGKIVKSE